jgi:hypothetical protein
MPSFPLLFLVASLIVAISITAFFLAGVKFGDIFDGFKQFIRRYHDTPIFIAGIVTLGIVVVLVAVFWLIPKHTEVKTVEVAKIVYTDLSATNLYAVAIFSEDASMRYLYCARFSGHSGQEALGFAFGEEKQQHPTANIVMYQVIQMQ